MEGSWPFHNMTITGGRKGEITALQGNLFIFVFEMRESAGFVGIEFDDEVVLGERQAMPMRKSIGGGVLDAAL